LKLNLGCGDDQREGYIGVDIRPGPAVQLSLDISKPLPLENDSIEVILANDVLEHLQRNEVEPTLRELYRVLEHKGRLKVKSPNIRVLAFALASGALDDREFERKMYGDQDYPENTHKCGFTQESLAFLLVGTGFTIISSSNAGARGDWSNFTLEAEKP